MNTEMATLNSLFEQLGLDSSEDAIENFLRCQSIPMHIPLHKASIWTRSQSIFLREAKEQDSEWSYLVDQLDLRLRRAL